MKGWFDAFAFTQAVEVPIYLLGFVRLASRRGAPAEDAERGALALPSSAAGRLLVALGASALTHPVVWFVFPELGLPTYVQMVLAAEAFAVLAEAGYLRLFGARRALLLALLANGASVSLGLASRWAFGWP